MLFANRESRNPYAPGDWPRGMFPLVAFSHVEADECGGLNQFLAAAPRAVPVCS